MNRTDLVPAMREPEREPLPRYNRTDHEYAVVWRWKTDRYRDEFSDERRKVYRTEAGARRLMAKLNKNGGKYEKWTETEPTRYDDGLTVEEWRLDYARLETRVVGPWEPSDV